MKTSMSGLQHPLEPNGRSSHIRFTPPIGTGNGGMAAYASNAPSGSAGPQPPFGPGQPGNPSSVPGGAASNTYIRASGASAPNIPPMASSNSGSGAANPATQLPQQQISQQTFEKSQQLAEFNRNPLLCLLCNQAFQNPCLLTCYHTFCAACLKGRAVDGKLACPICG